MIMKTKIIKISEGFVCGRFFLPKRILIATVRHSVKNGDNYYETTVVVGKSLVTSVRPPTCKDAMELHAALYAASGNYS